MQYIDLHSHKFRNDSNIQILNIFAQDLNSAKPACLFSAGLHLWHIGKVNIEDSFLALEGMVQNSNMVAVGECGLDRSISTPFAQQKEIFERQIDLAYKTLKPLIIHCVRAYPDLIEIKKRHHSFLPWIIHGYRGNQETTSELIKHGFYFSVGESLIKSIKLQHSLRIIPSDRLFFETDDRDFSIEKLYLFAAKVLETDEELLRQSIFMNFKNVFGDDKLSPYLKA